MRQRAQSAGTLKSTPQQTVTTEGQTIVIEPSNPQVVYVPVYDPRRVYGPSVMVYPGWVPIEGALIGSPVLSFGIGHHEFHGRPVGRFHERFHGEFHRGFHGGGFHHR
jgi:hypothetical protein